MAPTPPPTTLPNVRPSSARSSAVSANVQQSTGRPTSVPQGPSRSPAIRSALSGRRPLVEQKTVESFSDDDPLHQSSSCAHEPEPDCADGILSVEARVEYSAVARDMEQQVFGLITVRAGAQRSDTGTSERQPMDVICVLDVSGSMTGQKIGQVQSAVRFVIEQASPLDRLGLVTFNNTASRPLRLRKMNQDGKNDANVAALRLVADGGTSIVAGLHMALLGMEQRRQRNSVSAILLLTDGQDSSTRNHIQSLVQRAAAAGCGLYCFGFGADHDAALLSSFSEQAHTPFTFVEDVDTIKAAFAGTIGCLSSVVAQKLTLNLSSHVPLTAVHTPFAMVRDGSHVTVTIPDMMAEERRDLVVELSVPAAESGRSVLLDASVRYTNLTSGTEMQSATVSMSVDRCEEPQPEMEPDEEVSTQRERVEVTNALKEAALQCDQGRFDDAQQVLDASESRVKSKKTKNIEAMSLELQDAKARMKDRRAWQDGGKAEVSDACQMYSVQRCTNATVSSKSAVTKKSKQMFLKPHQSSSISKSE